MLSPERSRERLGDWRQGDGSSEIDLAGAVGTSRSVRSLMVHTYQRPCFGR
jgi:hypothetical protein